MAKLRLIEKREANVEERGIQLRSNNPLRPVENALWVNRIANELKSHAGGVTTLVSNIITNEESKKFQEGFEIKPATVYDDQIAMIGIGSSTNDVFFLNDTRNTSFTVSVNVAEGHTMYILIKPFTDQQRPTISATSGMGKVLPGTNDPINIGDCALFEARKINGVTYIKRVFMGPY